MVKTFEEGELQDSSAIVLRKDSVDLTSLGKSELFASTLRAISEGVISVDRGASITFLNPAAEGWTGWNARKAIGRQLRAVFPLLDAARGRAPHIPLSPPLRDAPLLHSVTPL